MKAVTIRGRKIGPNYEPFIIAEAGINHEGSFDKAKQLVDAAMSAGAECIKFQCHITESEMIPNDVKPKNASGATIWEVIKRCELTADEEKKLKRHCDKKGIIFLSTPFSREAADRLFEMDVPAFKIGSGECNNIPLIDHIARMKKPIILSTGMNDISTIRRSVDIIKRRGCPFILMHCTSMYPTPYDKVRLGAMVELGKKFGVPIGLSDHSVGIYTVLGAVALGASVVEKHFTISRDWPGPDNPISIEPLELADLVKGAKAIFFSLKGRKKILPEEKPVIDFAYACVVAIKDIRKGERFGMKNVWVKRPGTGQILAKDLYSVLDKKAKLAIKKDQQIRWGMIDE